MKMRKVKEFHRHLSRVDFNGKTAGLHSRLMAACWPLMHRSFRPVKGILALYRNQRKP